MSALPKSPESHRRVLAVNRVPLSTSVKDRGYHIRRNIDRLFAGIFSSHAAMARLDGGRVGSRVPASALSSKNVPVSYPRDAGTAPGQTTKRQKDKKTHLQGF